MKSDDLCMINSTTWAVGGLLSSNFNIGMSVGCLVVASGLLVASLLIAKYRRL